MTTSIGLIMSAVAVASDEVAERSQDILITFENDGARANGAGIGAPYRNRGRYSIAASARRSANDIASKYSLREIDHWPIRSLSVYCFVYRIPSGVNRDDIIEQLRSDARVESVQPLNEFETSTDSGMDYNDTLANLQHGLGILGINAAHRFSTGAGVRIAIIDGNADAGHEDLQGRLRRIRVFTDPDRRSDMDHGTAITSVIGAKTNNGAGIVGIAPGASMELLVSCWSEDGSISAVCDSFTLAKALDSLLDNPPEVLNLSLMGPDDGLLTRLIEKTLEAGVIVVAASTAYSNESNGFPGNMDQVIGVVASEQHLVASNLAFPESANRRHIYAPGSQIMVAVPDNAYDFRSGSSLSAAVVSGVIALLLAESPELSFDTVREILRESQSADISVFTSVNACVALSLASSTSGCKE